MKTRLIPVAMLLAVLAACDEPYYQEAPLDFDVEQDLKVSLETGRMPLLATRLNCTSCHAIDHKIVGPAWRDVGQRYKDADTYEYQGKTYPLVEGLVQKISHGGSGNWGDVAMPGIDPSGARRELVEKLVRFALAQGQP